MNFTILKYNLARLVFAIFLFHSGFALSQADNSCPNRHVGFEAIGAGTLGVKTDEQTGKKLESITVSINTGKNGFNNGLPLPCAYMMELRGVTKNDDTNSSTTDVFDLSLKKCSTMTPKTKISSFFKKYYNKIFKRDPNKDQEFQVYTFNPTDKNSFLTIDNLRTLYSTANINNNTKIEFNKILSRITEMGCSLKDKVINGKSYEDYITCNNIPSGKSIKSILNESSELSETCGISVKGNSFSDLFLFSTSEKNDSEFLSGQDAIAKCASKYNDKSTPAYNTFEFPISDKLPVKRENKFMDFKSYKKDCKLVSTSDLDKDLTVIEHISNVAKYYSDDIANCVNCLGANVVNDKVELTLRDAMNALENPCLSGIGQYIRKLRENCPLGDSDKSLSCTKINTCSLNLNLEDVQSLDVLPINDFDNMVSKFQEGINLKYVLPFHSTATLVSEQNRGLSSNSDVSEKTTLTRLKEHFDSLKACVNKEDQKYFKHLSMANPRAQTRYLGTALSNISNLVEKVGKYFNENTTEEQFSKNSQKIKEAFDEYGKANAALPKSEDQAKKLKLNNEDCENLSNIIADDHKCYLTKSAMENTTSKIKEYKDGLKDDEMRDKLENAINDFELGSYSENVKRYLELTHGLGSGDKKNNKTDDAVEFLALHNAIKSKVKDLEIERCDFSGPNIDMDEVSSVLGRGDKFLSKLTKNKKASDVTNAETTSDDSTNSGSSSEVSDLKTTIAGLQQQIAQLVANQGQNSNTSAMQALLAQQVQMFNQYANSLQQTLQGATSYAQNIFGMAVSKMQWSPQYTFQQPNYPQSNTFGSYMNSSNQFNSFNQPVSGYNQTQSNMLGN